jgi:hypothetical protein
MSSRGFAPVPLPHDDHVLHHAGGVVKDSSVGTGNKVFILSLAFDSVKVVTIVIEDIQKLWPASDII